MLASLHSKWSTGSRTAHWPTPDAVDLYTSYSPQLLSVLSVPHSPLPSQSSPMVAMSHGLRSRATSALPAGHSLAATATGKSHVFFVCASKQCERRLSQDVPRIEASPSFLRTLSRTSRPYTVVVVVVSVDEVEVDVDVDVDVDKLVEAVFLVARLHSQMPSEPLLLLLPNL